MTKMNNLHFFDYRNDVVIVKFSSDEPPRETYLQYLLYLTNKLKQQRPVTIIIDIRCLSRLFGELVSLQKDWEDQHHDQLVTRQTKRIYVINNLLSEVMINAVFDVIDPDAPFDFTMDLQEALNMVSH